MCRKQMDFPDTVRVLLSYLDDDVIGRLMTSGVVTYDLAMFSDQHWWHDRIETLSGARIDYDGVVDWNQTYQILKIELQKQVPSFHNNEDNIAVLRVLLAMGFSPENSYESLSKAA